MPTLSEVIAGLSFLTTGLAVVGLVVTAGLITVIRDWRVSLAALLTQYLLVGFLLTQLIIPEVAAVKVLVGALICPILYLTARRASWGRQESRSTGCEVFPVGLPFRLLAVVLMGLVASSLLSSYPLPEVPRDIGFACYWLALAGLLVLILTTEPLKAGLGLLTFMAGFELFYAALESSLSVVGSLGIINLFMALAIAYLASARGPAQRVGDVEGFASSAERCLSNVSSPFSQWKALVHWLCSWEGKSKFEGIPKFLRFRCTSPEEAEPVEEQ